MKFEFEILSKPQPKQRPRRDSTGKWYTPTKTANYEKLAGLSALCERPRGWDLTRKYSVKITLLCPDRRHRDLDNIGKSILDGMNAIVWADDSQIDTFHITRTHRPGKPWHTLVEVSYEE